MAIPLSANGNTYNYPETGDTVWGDNATNLVSSICAYLSNVGGGASLNPAAIIELNSTTKGFLPSRMTTTQRNAIATPPTGLIVYNTTTNSIDVYNGTAWVGTDAIFNSIKAAGSGGLLIESNTGTDVVLLGAGSGSGATFYGGVNITGALAVTGKVTSASMPAGSILQVVSTALTTTFSTASTSFVDLTGVSATITPISASSRILVMASVSAIASSSTNCYLRLRRGSTDIGIGTSVGSRIATTSSIIRTSETGSIQSVPLLFVDSPASVSAQTYLVRIAVASGGTAYVNSASDDSDNAARGRPISTITLLEIAG
jgi:hypothetical protein